LAVNTPVVDISEKDVPTMQPPIPLFKRPVSSRAMIVTLSALVAAPLALLSGRAAVGGVPPKPLDADQKVLHVLNRLAFGPRPGDVAAVRRMGLDRWIDRQLSPETIDDSAAQSKLARLTSLSLSLEALDATLKDDRMQQKAFKAQQKAEKQSLAANTTAASSPAVPNAGGPTAMERNPAMEPPKPVRPIPASIEALGELDDAKLLLACESQRQLQEVLVDFWTNHFNLDVKKGPVRVFKIADERDVIRPHVFGKFRDLLEASAQSPAMLYYLDNASSTRDFSDPSTAPPALQRRMPRGNAYRPLSFRPRFGFGRNRMAAVRMAQRQGFGSNVNPAQTPAFQANNAATQVAAGANGKKRAGGLNENYARELMELHTLGVDGGYTQKDVQEVARCFTGWSIDRQTGTFRFYPARHDYGAKIVLGHPIPAGGGIQDGETVLDILAAHPSTAHFIARKLCQRLVSDSPPAALVNRAAQTFLNTGGDLRAVVRTIVTSPEFDSPAAYRSKIKSPFEYAVSAVRALGGTIDVPDPNDSLSRLRLVADGASSTARSQNARYGKRVKTSLAQAVAAMGEPLYSHEAPTGYPEDSREWLSTGSLLARFNFAMALANGQVAEVETAPSTLLQDVSLHDPQAVVNALSRAMLGTDLSATTRAAIAKQESASADPVKVAGLILGSPEFQRH
jgi:uncharacterized protein (DUF1800 family)